MNNKIQTGPRFIAPMEGVGSSAGPVMEYEGFRWISVATFGLAPCAPSATHVLHRSDDDLNATIYQAIADKIEFDQPAVDVSEVFYVIEGSVTRVDDDGHIWQWGSADVGYQGYNRNCRLAYGSGTRLVRFLWSYTRLPAEFGEVTGNPMKAPPPTGGHFQAPTSLRSYEDISRWMVHYHDAPIYNVPLFEDSDKRRAAIYAADAARRDLAFDDPVVDLQESMFIIQGTIELTPKGSETLRWTAGDLVYWPYGREQSNHYSAGLTCVCFFWSKSELPDFRKGEASAVMAQGRGSAG